MVEDGPKDAMAAGTVPGGKNSMNSNGLDYTGDKTANDHIPSPRVGPEYDPRPQKDAPAAGTVPGKKTSMNSNGLDYTGDETANDHIPSPRVGPEYDPRPQEDRARRTIAYLLIGLLWFVVVGIFIFLSFGSIQIENIKDFGVVLSPIIALVSAATGFYYGTKTSYSKNGK